MRRSLLNLFKGDVRWYVVLLLVFLNIGAYAQNAYGWGEIIQKSDLIFKGNVSSINCRWNDKGTMIFTDVAFSNVTTIAGSDSSKQKGKDTITVTFAGGKVGENKVKAGVLPKFEVGNTYILFVQDDGNVYLNPIIGAGRGKLGIVTDSVTQSRFLVNASGRVLLQSTDSSLSLSKLPLSKIRNGVAEYAGGSDKHKTPDPLSSRSVEKSFPTLPDTVPGDIPAQVSKKPVSEDELIRYIRSIYLPQKAHVPRPNDGGYFFHRVKDSVIKEKLTCARFDSTSKISIIKPSIQGNASGGRASMISACGYHNLPITMEQVPSSFWTYTPNANMLSDWNLFMSIYRTKTSDGRFGEDNGQNEFVNAISDASLYSVYGFHWGEALAMCITFGGENCYEITESDVMFNSAKSWTDDPEFAVYNYDVYSYLPIMMHEMGHSWGSMLDEDETYDYSEMTVMQGYNCQLYETGRGIHYNDAYMLRRMYDDQTSIKNVTDVGIESYYADNGFNPATTDKSSYNSGASITLSNITAENNSYSSVSDVRLRYYLSTDRDITTSDYQLGGPDYYTYWTTFYAESYSVFSKTMTIPADVPTGTYYVGMIITVDGFNSDDFTGNNSTSFSQTITVINNNTSNTAPTGVAAYYSADNDGISVSWNLASNASYYRVYRSTSSYGTYSYLGYIYGTSFSDNSGTSGTTYYYKVTTVTSGGTESDFSNYDYATMGSGNSTTSIYAPSNVSAYYYTSYNNIYVSWSSESNASSYQVYRSTTMYGTYTYVTSVYTISYTDADITYGNTYYYAIKAVNSSAVASSLSNSAYATVTYYNNGYANDVKDVEGQKATISIYPNPTTDYINIKVATGTSDNATIVILDISGSFVYNGKRGDEVNSVDVSSFAEGTYFVEILDNNTIVGRQSFIVKR